jgi:hypothetical protein
MSRLLRDQSIWFVVPVSFFRPRLTVIGMRLNGKTRTPPSFFFCSMDAWGLLYLFMDSKLRTVKRASHDAQYPLGPSDVRSRITWKSRMMCTSSCFFPPRSPSGLLSFDSGWRYIILQITSLRVAKYVERWYSIISRRRTDRKVA